MSRWALLGMVCAALGCGTPDGGASTKVAVHASLPPEDAGARYDAAYPRGEPTPPPNDFTGGTATPPPPTAKAPDPIDAPRERWTWIDIEGSRCADGTPTGAGVSLTDATDDLMVFFEGGGACWDASSCYGVVSTAFNLSGYGKAEFEGDGQRNVPVLDRTRPTNPFRAMSMVFIPYCTGDVHAGTRMATYDVNGTARPAYHVGAKNFALLLGRLKATRPNPKNVWVAGSSAGGFAAALNFPRVFDAFPLARVNVLDDSGQPIGPEPERWKAWRDAWGLEPPAECPQCNDDIANYVDFYRVRYPSSRFGLITYKTDAVISTFMNLGPVKFEEELDAFAARADKEWPFAKYFFLSGSLHVGLYTGYSDAMDTWIHRMATYDPAWTSVKP